MKLLKPESCLGESGGGNVKTQTALGDALVFWSSDRGSTPLGSTTTSRDEHNLVNQHDQGGVRLDCLLQYQIIQKPGLDDNRLALAFLVYNFLITYWVRI